jgi:hypothetical protein
MKIVFGWNRFKLKSFTFQELNLPELEQFPNATIQVAQSYFHIFWIPVFPMGKRYDLVMNKELYHVPPSLMKLIDPEQIKVKGKWYAWSLPILAVVIMLGVYFNEMYTEHKYQQQSIEYAESQRKFFDTPMVGDHIRFSNANLEFDAEVFNLTDSKVILFLDLLHVLDKQVLEKAQKGQTRLGADSLQLLMNERDELENNSRFRDSLLAEYPDQPLFTRLLTFELEGYPIKYEMIHMSLNEYKALKKSIGDGVLTKPKQIKVPAFKPITKYGLYVNPQ